MDGGLLVFYDVVFLFVFEKGVNMFVEKFEVKDFVLDVFVYNKFIGYI